MPLKDSTQQPAAPLTYANGQWQQNGQPTNPAQALQHRLQMLRAASVPQQAPGMQMPAAPPPGGAPSASASPLAGIASLVQRAQTMPQTSPGGAPVAPPQPAGNPAFAGQQQPSAPGAQNPNLSALVQALIGK